MNNDNDKLKWDNYYANDNIVPPWESEKPFHGLIKALNELNLNPRDFNNVIELGCGRSQSAIYLSSQLYNVTAIDFCSKAINDAKLLSDKVNWICGDILDDNLFNNSVILKESYDIVFDMQCFHVLKDINETRACEVIFNCLKKGGLAIIIVGAKFLTIEQPKTGPTLLTIEEFTTPFLKTGLQLVSIEVSEFNETEYYLTLENIPKCYIGIFKKC